ncbi:MAG: ADP-ribosylglycohydrolase family protein [Candidatus Firestonebacteria bacterium]
MSFKFSLESLVLGEVDFLKRYDFTIPKELDQKAIKKLNGDEKGLLKIYEMLQKLPEPKTPCFSLSDYKSIVKDFPKQSLLSLSLPKELEVKDKIFAGWLGRAAGCILGKPLECGLTLPEIKKYFGKEFPIKDYISFSIAHHIALEKNPAIHPHVTKPCSREHIAYAMEDDDLNYTVLNLLLLEQKGHNFSIADVGNIWASYLPVGCTYGAETTALINFLCGLPIDRVPIYLNHFRDEIGAQIRADTFGYVCPGQPQLAAKYAFRDAAFSHTADGIYGEMFVAAAFSAKSIEDIIKYGLGQVPKNSRLAELVNKTLVWYSSLGNWEAVYDKIKVSTSQYKDGHTINNAAYVVNALLASNGDYESGITIAVMQGHDTDCNGATVGSILGVYLGAKHLPEKWIRPLNDCLKTSLKGLSKTSISELAERVFRVSTLAIN